MLREISFELFGCINPFSGFQVEQYMENMKLLYLKNYSLKLHKL